MVRRETASEGGNDRKSAMPDDREMGVQGRQLTRPKARGRKEGRVIVWGKGGLESTERGEVVRPRSC